jgi:Flp pilus assembly protein TadD
MPDIGSPEENAMMYQRFRRGLLMSAVALGLLASATPAFAQAQGSLRGVITDEAGKPIPEAELIFEYIGDIDITLTGKTNTRGEFTRVGMRTGQWKMQAKKGELIGMQTVRVTINQMTKVDDLIIKAVVAGATDTSGMTEKEIDARNKLMASMETEFSAGVAAITTNPDEAIAKFNIVAAAVPNCAICYSKIGDANMKKPDEAAAEAAYLKAIELDAKLPDPYAALAVLYNQQKKFDEASAMSVKANELLAATGAGGDPANMYNQAIILWNAGKYPEAKAEFEKVIAKEPTMAEAHFRLGMANLNLGEIPGAIKALEAYLKLAPTGENAEMATAILKQIK